MQKWNGRSGQCVFCLFGLPKLPTTRNANPTRQFSVANARARRDEFRTIRLRPNPPTRFRISKPRVVNGQRKDQAQLEEPVAAEELTEDKLHDRLSRCLDTVRNQLRIGKKGGDDEKHSTDSLDADGTIWSGFKEEVHNAIRGLEKRQSGETTSGRLREELLPLLTPSKFMGPTARYLRFAFIDRILAGRDVNANKAVAAVADLRWPTEWYAKTRSIQRDIHLHIGPTNSGKTYNALKRLEEAKSGFYAGPLRLLAHEVYSRFRGKGMRCDLVTGDDIREDQDGEGRAPRASMTVEMVSTSRPFDVAVIDEIQMMASDDRGWAWTRAFLGARAKEVHLCGEARVLPLIQELSASMGDNLHVHHYERLNPLKVMSRSLRGDFKNLRKGDCVVCFSIMTIHALKKQIERETGRRVAIVYGSLPPETRAQQAEHFNDPNNDFDYLVASDAVGMGLNLAIKRIIFETTYKFNGERRERLSIPQVKQIAGRAGRYRTSRDDKVGKRDHSSAEQSVGLVTALDESDLPYIQDALATEPPPIRAAGILPPVDFVEEYAVRLPAGVSYEYILQRLCDVSTTHPRFKLCDIRDQLAIGRCIEPIRGLTILDRCQFSAAPADTKSLEAQMILQEFARCVAAKREVSVADIRQVPLEVLQWPLTSNRIYLETLEKLHKSLVLYLWLSYRFHNVFRDQDMAFHAKEMCESRINTYLMTFSANPKLRKRLDRMRKLEAHKQSQAEYFKEQEQIEDQGKEKDFREGDVQEEYADEDRPDPLTDEQRVRGGVSNDQLRNHGVHPSVRAPVYDYEQRGSNEQTLSNA